MQYHCESHRSLVSIRDIQPETFPQFVKNSPDSTEKKSGMSFKRRGILFFLSIASTAVLLSCTKGVPTIEDMGSLSGFSVDQSQVRGTLFLLSGGCSNQFSGVVLSLDNGTSWKDITDFSSDFAMNCSAGNNYSGHLTLPGNPPSFLVRGVGPLGASPSYVVAMAALVPFRPNLITAGATLPTNPSSGGGYKVRGAIMHEGRLPGQSMQLQGTGYKVKGAGIGL